jgi:anti-sigma-K factor RskA
LSRHTRGRKIKYSDPRLLDHLASTFALGTLDGKARQRFMRLMRDCADVRLLVAEWEERINGLASSIQPIEPSPWLWSGLLSKINELNKPAKTQVIEQQVPSRIFGWLKAFTLAASGFAATILLITVAPLSFISLDRVAMKAEKLPQSYVGLLTDTNGAPTILASSLRQGRTLTIKVLKPINLPPSTQLRLWAVPDSGAPFLLGIVPPKGNASVELADTSEKLLSKITKLIVIVEVDGASSQMPTGTPLLTGNCVKLW